MTQAHFVSGTNWKPKAVNLKIAPIHNRNSAPNLPVAKHSLD